MQLKVCQRCGHPRWSLVGGLCRPCRRPADSRLCRQCHLRVVKVRGLCPRCLENVEPLHRDAMSPEDVAEIARRVLLYAAQWEKLRRIDYQEAITTAGDVAGQSRAGDDAGPRTEEEARRCSHEDDGAVRAVDRL